jgi:hypothetical protein
LALGGGDHSADLVIGYWHLWNGGLLGKQAAAELGIRIALGAQRKEVLQSALGRALNLLAIGSAARSGAGSFGEPGAGFDRVSGNSSRSAGLGRCHSVDAAAGTGGYVDSGATRTWSRSSHPAARGVSRFRIEVVAHTGLLGSWSIPCETGKPRSASSVDTTSPIHSRSLISDDKSVYRN